MAASTIHERVPLEGVEPIRLLSLEPAATTSDPLAGTLSLVSLADDPQYEALSYCWGSPFKEQVLANDSISLDGARLAITGNLAHALRRIRRTTTSSRLWIDAICINQADEIEKSLQVPLMAKIYGKSSQTLVWLGEDSKARDGEIMFGLYTAYCQGGSWTSSGWSYTRPSTPLGDIPEARNAAEEEIAYKLVRPISGLSCKQMDDAKALFGTRQYFDRRWVLQEMLLARRVMLLCGQHKTTWEHLLFSNRAYQSDRPLQLTSSDTHFAGYDDDEEPPGLVNGALIDFDGIMTLLRSGTRASAQNWLEILAVCWRNQCSDPRDVLFALISILPGCEFRPDYSLPWDTVLTNFACYCVRYTSMPRLLTTDEQHPREESMDGAFFGNILAYAAIQPDKRLVTGPENSTLPSWVPPWRTPIPWAALDNLYVPIRTGTAHEGTLSAQLGLYGSITRIESSYGGDQNAWLGLLDPSGNTYHESQTGWEEDSVFGRDPELDPGDLVCSPIIRPNPVYRPNAFGAIVLRPIGNEACTCQLVGICRVGRFNFYKAIQRTAAPAKQIKVNIV